MQAWACAVEPGRMSTVAWLVYKLATTLGYRYMPKDLGYAFTDFGCNESSLSLTLSRADMSDESDPGNHGGR